MYEIIQTRDNVFTITSHRNLGHPFPPKDKSHGGGPCQSPILSNCFPFNITPADDCLLPFFLDIFGALSDSLNRSFSPYFLTIFEKDSSKGILVLCEILQFTPSAACWEYWKEAVARTMSRASQTLVVMILFPTSGFSRISFNPRSKSKECSSAMLLKEFPVNKTLQHV